MIRLRQQGARNGQTYRLVVTDRREKRDGKYIEMVGVYDPHKDNDNALIKEDRIVHWLSLGATLSDRAKEIVKRASPELIRKHDDELKKNKQKRSGRKKSAAK